MQVSNPYLDYLIVPSFQGVNRSFVLYFEQNHHWTIVEIKAYNIMIDGCNVFNKPVNDNSRTHYYIRKITTGQEDGYTNGFLLGYNCFNK